MKHLIRVSFGIPRAKRDYFYEMLKGAAYLDGWKEANPSVPTSNPSVECAFDLQDPKLMKLRSLMRGEDTLYWNEWEDRIYNDTELRECPLLWLEVRKPLFEGGGPKCGTEYDASSGCPHCGSGAIQTSPLGVPPGKLPRKGQICGTYRHDILVGKELASALRKAEVSGLELRQVRSHRNKKPLPWWQIISAHAMPKMSPKTPGLERETAPGWGCPGCGRDGYGGNQEVVYDHRKLDVGALPDVVQTWECFGQSVPQTDPQWSTSCGPAHTLILMKPRIADIFRELKIKQFEFLPVWIK